MQRITPCLWFEDQAEEAASFYTTIFKNSRIGRISRYSEAGFEFHGKPSGSVMTVEFELDGQGFLALNGGPGHPITDAVSFTVNCETQAEVDEYWERLSAGGKEIQCGWLTDKYGVSWQVVPAMVAELMNDPDPEKRERVMQAMLPMVKLDIDTLKNAYQGL